MVLPRSRLPPRPDVQVEKAIGRSSADRRLMTTLEAGGRPALSGVRAVAREKELLLLEVKPRTGRTHQIRVAGMPWVMADHGQLMGMVHVCLFIEC